MDVYCPRTLPIDPTGPDSSGKAVLVTSPLRNRHARMLLLATTAILCAGAAITASAAAPTDMGALAADTPLHATIWLRPHDEAAFEAAVAERMAPGSTQYHKWMTPAQVAAYNVGSADIDALEAAFRQQGLTVLGHDDDHASIRIAGSAAAMQSAFGTALHVFDQNGARSFRAMSEPAFRGAHAELIAGITGLTNAPMTPYVLHQMDLSTGKPEAMQPALVVKPDTRYTDQCFIHKYTLSVTRFGIGGAVHGTFVGPHYTAGGFPVSKKTCGYTASEVAAHYGLNAAYDAGLKGDGQTIVLIDAYGSPTILSDANIFSRKMGLPPLDDTSFSVVFPEGAPTQDPYPTGWPTEISLDVEWAHAMAPNAKIVLVVAPTDDEASLTEAVHYATIHQLGTIISASFGYPEAAYGPAGARAFNTVIRQAAAQGIAVNVATGDSGDFGLGTPVGAASIPADSPYATAVGGTSLDLPGDKGPVEAVWGITSTFLANLNFVSFPPTFQGFNQGGGGGESVYLTKPHYQHALVGVGRLLPDVSAIADPQTGAIIVAPSGDGTETVEGVVGGTSLSSPVFSGIWALADQAAGESLGQAAPILAALPPGALTDIVPIPATRSNLNGIVTKGSTTLTYTPVQLLHLQKIQPTGFVGVSATFGLDVNYDLGFGADSSLMAEPGWDDATGYGVPGGLAFIRAAAAAK